MKYSLLLSSLTAVALSMPLPLLADDAHHPDKVGAPAAANVTAPSKAPAKAPTVKKMQGNVKKMQAQLDRLGKAKTEAEAQAILAEHMQTMRENMMLGRDMAGMACPMMGGGMMHGMMGGEGAGHEAMEQRMQQMEKRMDTMEQMQKSAPGR